MKFPEAAQRDSQIKRDESLLPRSHGEKNHIRESWLPCRGERSDHLALPCPEETAVNGLQDRRTNDDQGSDEKEQPPAPASAWR